MAFNFVGYGLTFGITSAFVTWFTAVAGSGVGTRRVEWSVNGAFFESPYLPTVFAYLIDVPTPHSYASGAIFPTFADFSTRMSAPHLSLYV
ncbi:hypothetical protein BD410DRAFT_788298 [Rickenella mellea]|uniref:Uncharacterized protein n=1 Tax=Rickenella mellea TaxID=50990 RepID=A0A4Y7Q599_9AGAM|nr:hypothetical protein BD410DRAFT_788298 [Rickenella mellea]